MAPNTPTMGAERTAADLQATASAADLFDSSDWMICRLWHRILADSLPLRKPLLDSRWMLGWLAGLGSVAACSAGLDPYRILCSILAGCLAG